MPIYRVECVNRQTGVPYPVLIEALKPEDAAEYCSAQGHLVGRVVQERDLAVGASLPSKDMLAVTAPPPAPKPPTESKSGVKSGVANGYKPVPLTAPASPPPANGSAGSSLVPALTDEESQWLREAVEHLAAIRRSPIVHSPKRTIAAGVLLGFTAVSVVGMIVFVIMLILGFAGVSRAIGGAGIDGGQIQQLQQLLEKP